MTLTVDYSWTVVSWSSNSV